MVQNSAADVSQNGVQGLKKVVFKQLSPLQTKVSRTGHLYATGALFIYINHFDVHHEVWIRIELKTLCSTDGSDSANSLILVKT